MQQTLAPQPPFNADVIVIGAGIQGAGIAQACALNGWQAVVLERNTAPAMETSCASSKLIHGGLRYLETLQVHLVYECLRERKWLLNNAADLVHLSPFFIPIYKHSSRKPWWVCLGLSAYAVLGGMAKANRFKKVAPEQWSTLGIEQTDLLAVYQYFDAQTDDKILTQRVLTSAQALGASVHFEQTVQTINKLENGFEVQAAANSWRAPCVINAAGPWVNNLEAIDLPTLAIDWVQGVHIVLPRECTGGCFYVEAQGDQRPMFFLPWKGQTLVGTTERVLTAPNATATESEINYLLNTYNHYYPANPCARDEVIEVMVGMRVLPKSEKGANKRHRETQLVKQANDGGLYLGVYGGKLTSYRAVAERVSREVAKIIRPKNGPLKLTRKLPF